MDGTQPGPFTSSTIATDESQIDFLVLQKQIGTPAKDLQHTPPPTPRSYKTVGLESGWYAIAKSNRYHTLITNQYWECYTATRVQLPGANESSIPCKLLFIHTIFYNCIFLALNSVFRLQLMLNSENSQLWMRLLHG